MPKLLVIVSFDRQCQQLLNIVHCHPILSQLLNIVHCLPNYCSYYLILFNNDLILIFTAFCLPPTRPHLAGPSLSVICPWRSSPHATYITARCDFARANRDGAVDEGEEKIPLKWMNWRYPHLWKVPFSFFSQWEIYYGEI